MSIKEMPKITTVSGGKIWTHTFEKFKATVYVPENEMMDDVLNYGFIAPYLLVFRGLAPTGDAYLLASSNSFITSMSFFTPSSGIPL